MNELQKNGSGYSDPTAYKAMKNVVKEENKIKKLRSTIHNICELAGYRIEGRIVLRNVKTGEKWR